MPLGVLNNISAIYAENNLNQTQSSLQNTLTQLSSGQRINSGADDSAGLAIANGLQANSSALSQSSANATAGVGFLQVADGALAQVTNLLNRAITLATEAGGGTLSSSQMSAADQEYQDILTQINTIGSTTEYNNILVFTSTTGSTNALTTASFSQSAAGNPLNVTLHPGDTLSGSITITTSGGSGAGAQIVDLGSFAGLDSTDAATATAAATALQGALNGGALHTASGANYTVSINSNTGVLSIATNTGAEVLGVSATTASETSASSGINIYTSDGTAGGSHNYSVTVGTLNASSVGTSLSTSGAGSTISASVGGVSSTHNGTGSGAGTGTHLTGTVLTSQADAEAALQTVNNAISAVAYQRGQVGANINTLTAASNISSSEQTNITSAQNAIMATDYAAATSNMSKYEILTQTGISALAQANSTQQMVTKLLQ